MPDDSRIVVTLGVEASTATRGLAAKLGVTNVEAVRRGLSLLQLWADLPPNEELVVRDRDSGELERIHFQWAVG